MKKILIATVLAVITLNVAACSSDSWLSEMSARTRNAQNAANDSLRK